MTTTPRRRRAAAIFAAALVGSGLIGSLFTTVPAAADESRACDRDTVTTETVARFTHCDMTGWTLEAPNGFTMVVPAPGEVAQAATVTEAGHTTDMSVLQSRTGGVAASIEGGGAFAVTDAAARTALDALQGRTSRSSSRAATAAKCSSSAPYAIGSRWPGGRYTWHYRPSGQPSRAAFDRIYVGAATLVAGWSTTCGHLPSGHSQAYGGTSAGGVGVTSTGCGSRNGVNVIGWGHLTGTHLGRACWWQTAAGSTIEADIKFDNSYRSWFISPSTSGCTGGSYDLQGVATHEIGHAVGLQHVGASEQVMSPSLVPCSTAWRQLGRGDQYGLRALYGT